MTRATLEKIMQRDANKCVLCGKKPAKVVQIISAEMGGNDEPINLCLLCPEHEAQYNDKDTRENIIIRMQRYMDGWMI